MKTEKIFLPTIYRDVDRLLAGRNLYRRKIAGNTYLVRLMTYPTTIALRYHDTNVVVYHKDNRIVLDSGGYKTLTTKQRINWALPFGYHLYQKDFDWFIDFNDQTIPFVDLMALQV